MATLTVGTGETNTTISGWYSGLATTFTEDETAELKAQSYAESLALNGKTHGSFKATIKAPTAVRHNGKSNALSSLGNARIDYTGANVVVSLRDENFVIEGLEIIGPGNNAVAAIRQESLASGAVHRYSHNLIHNDGASTSDLNDGIFLDQSVCTFYVYNNIVYGFGSSGIRCDNANTGSYVIHNTCYGNNRANSSSRSGIAIGTNADTNNITVESNAVFDNGTAYGYQIRTNTRGVQNYNYMNGTVAEGANSVGSLTTANQFTNPTTTWASCDLTVKAGANLIGASPGYSTTTFPGIDTACDGVLRGVSGWDIGACEYANAAPATSFPPVQPNNFARLRFF